MVEVVAALIKDGDKILICQRPANKKRGMLWEFVGGKVEAGETMQQALIRECREELDITLAVGDEYISVVHEYPDITVHLTLFNAAIVEGTPKLLEHNAIKWVTVGELSQYDFCPADEDILKKIIADEQPPEDNILLVDIFDNEVGYAAKLEAHMHGLLHRAFSVFLHDGRRMLLQKRCLNKYHSGGLLTNACCSHQRKGEQLNECVRRRVSEELGISTEVKELFSFIYRSVFDYGITEYEYDHVFVAEYSGKLNPDSNEIADIVWVDIDELAQDLQANPQRYTVWFLTAAPRVIEYINRTVDRE